MCCEEGAYRYVCNENGEDFATATGALEGSSMTFEDAMKDACFMLKDLGNDCWQFTEHFMGQTMCIQIKMNEEIDYNFPGWERKMFCTRLGNRIFQRFNFSTLFYPLLSKDFSQQAQVHHEEERRQCRGVDEVLDS